MVTSSHWYLFLDDDLDDDGETVADDASDWTWTIWQQQETANNVRKIVVAAGDGRMVVFVWFAQAGARTTNTDYEIF